MPPAVGERWRCNTPDQGFELLTDAEFDWQLTEDAADLRREIAWSAGWSERQVYDLQCTREYLEQIRTASHSGKLSQGVD